MYYYLLWYGKWYFRDVRIPTKPIVSDLDAERLSLKLVLIDDFFRDIINSYLN